MTKQRKKGPRLYVWPFSKKKAELLRLSWKHSLEEIAEIKGMHILAVVQELHVAKQDRFERTHRFFWRRAIERGEVDPSLSPYRKA